MPAENVLQLWRPGALDAGGLRLGALLDLEGGLAAGGAAQVDRLLEDLLGWVVAQCDRTGVAVH